MASKRVKTDTLTSDKKGESAMNSTARVITIRRRMRAPVPKNQTPRERFQRLAPRRVTNALNDIRRVGNLLNHNVYESTTDELNRIEMALDRAIEQLKMKLEQAKKPRPEGTKGSNVEVFRLQA